jgi:hypothetical protein
MELTTIQRDRISRQLARLLIGVLRTGQENPEIMARGYIIDAYRTLTQEVDIRQVEDILNVSLERDDEIALFQIWYKSAIEGVP